MCLTVLNNTIVPWLVSFFIDRKVYKTFVIGTTGNTQQTDHLVFGGLTPAAESWCSCRGGFHARDPPVGFIGVRQLCILRHSLYWQIHL